MMKQSERMYAWAAELDITESVSRVKITTRNFAIETARLEADNEALRQFRDDVYAAYTPNKHCNIAALERVLLLEQERREHADK